MSQLVFTSSDDNVQSRWAMIIAFVCEYFKLKTISSLSSTQDAIGSIAATTQFESFCSTFRFEELKKLLPEGLLTGICTDVDAYVLFNCDFGNGFYAVKSDDWSLEDPPVYDFDLSIPESDVQPEPSKMRGTLSSFVLATLAHYAASKRRKLLFYIEDPDGDTESALEADCSQHASFGNAITVFEYQDCVAFKIPRVDTVDPSRDCLLAVNRSGKSPRSELIRNLVSMHGV